MKTILLGQKVKDIVTGLEGIAVMRAEYLHGCARVGIQPPKDKEGKVPEWIDVDEPQIEVIVKKQILKTKKPKVLIMLGQKIHDPVSGAEGIAVGRCSYLNGCARICLQPRLDNDGKKQKSIWFDEPQLKAVKNRREVAPGARLTGGPAPSRPNRSY